MKIPAAILIAVSLACQRPVTPSLAADISVRLAGDFSQIDRGIAVLRAPGLADETLPLIKEGDSVISGTFKGVPEGGLFTLEVSLFQGIILKLQGEKSFAVEGETPLALAVDLLPVEEIAGGLCFDAKLAVQFNADSTQYLVSWNPYPDLQEFADLKLSYTIIKDDDLITGSFDDYKTKVAYQDNRKTSVSLSAGGDSLAYFAIVLFSEIEKIRIYDCGPGVYIQKTGT